jgi:preprotein translocase SecE subunit
MPNITRIKSTANQGDKPPKKSKPKATPTKSKKSTPPPRPNRLLRLLKAPLIPLRPIARYVHNSWLEIRQVRWPDRKLTWKMTLAVIVYTAIFIVIIAALDALFTFVFNNLLTN